MRIAKHQENLSAGKAENLLQQGTIMWSLPAD
jgi:hypothetical protein